MIHFLYSLHLVQCSTQIHYNMSSSELHDTKDGKEWVVEMDFLGKDSIR